MIALDTIPAMFKTLLNVTADMTVAGMLERERPQRDQLSVLGDPLDARA